MPFMPCSASPFASECGDPAREWHPHDRGGFTNKLRQGSMMFHVHSIDCFRNSERSKDPKTKKHIHSIERVWKSHTHSRLSTHFVGMIWKVASARIRHDKTGNRWKMHEKESPRAYPHQARNSAVAVVAEGVLAAEMKRVRSIQKRQKQIRKQHGNTGCD